MAKYKIVKNRVQLWDPRFDHYSDEALSFFDKLESLAGSPPPIALSDTRELVEWRDKRWKDFGEAIENCRHKIQAVNYSVSLIESEIKNPPIPNYQSLPINLDETEFFDDVILFEFESFLFQISSTLDVFVHLLVLFYPALYSEKKYKIGFKGKDGIAGKKTAILLKESGELKLARYIEKQTDAWIQKIYDLRNGAMHQSKVKDLQMFLIDKNGLHVPKLSNGGIDLLVYCRDAYKNLKVFLNFIESNFLLVKTNYFYDKKYFCTEPS